MITITLFFSFLATFSSHYFNNIINKTAVEVPIIIVPGFAGSVLAFSKNEINAGHAQRIWSPISLLYKNQISKELIVYYDKKTDSFYNYKNYSVYPMFGKSVKSIEDLTGWSHFLPSFTYYFSNLVSELDNVGYKDKKSLWALPYDFRRITEKTNLNSYINEFKNLCEKLYNDYGEAPIIISHSLGSTLTNYLLNGESREWKDKYVRIWISMNGLLAPLNAPLKEITYGVKQLHHWYICSILQKALKISQTWPSVYSFMKSRVNTNIDEIIAYVDDKPVKVSELQSLLETIGIKNAKVYLNKSQDLFPKIDPYVRSHFIYSTGLETADLVHFKKVGDDFKFEKKNTVMGDTLIPEKTLTKFLEATEYKDHLITYKEFKNIDHEKIVYNKNAISYLMKFLKKFTQLP